MAKRLTEQQSRNKTWRVACVLVGPANLGCRRASPRRPLTARGNAGSKAGGGLKARPHDVAEPQLSLGASQRRRRTTIACATSARAKKIPRCCSPRWRSRNRASALPNAGDEKRSPAPLRRERILPSSEEVKVMYCSVARDVGVVVGGDSGAAVIWEVHGLHRCVPAVHYHQWPGCAEVLRRRFDLDGPALPR